MTDLPVVNMIDVKFTVNGHEVSAHVPENMMLMKYLREELKLTGVKNGCASGHCGACSVIINGKVARSCITKMSRMNGAVVQTIEGLAQDGHLHPVQRAFIETGAVQCGFCTPGMIMAGVSLLNEKPHPTAEEIKTHLTKNRNTCRCTGYIKIIEAIQLAAEWMAEGAMPAMPTGPEEINRSRRNRDSYSMVTGELKYGDDMEVENMLHGKIYWADYPHAKILKVDTTEAEKMPGVVAVITAKDIPGKNQAGIVIRDQPAIAADKTRYIGDSLAAVFAETLEQAEAAVKKIKVDYEVLPGVFSPEEAAKPDAPKVHKKGNLLHHAAADRGDVEEAFKKCVAIVEGDYSTPHIEHGFMEPESGLGFPSADGGVEIRLGSQCVFDDRIQLSEILDMPQEKIRVIQNPIGGAFGAKEDMILQQYLALGALKTKRPVKMVMTREESLRVHVKRHPARMHYKTGADKAGHVLALEATITLDTGAYCSLGLDVLENTAVFGAGPYYVPNVKINSYSWYTNNVLSGAMRGFGVNQIAIALEQQFDMLAEQLGIDPFKFRMINALDVGLPSATDHIMEEGVVSIKETIQAAEEAFRKLEIPKPAPGKKIGWGVASAVKNIGFGHGIPESSGADIEMKPDGTVILRHSQHEYGQGAQAGLVKLVMNELGVSAEQITVIGPDTGQTPPTGPTTASRQTFLTGNAVVMAAKRMKSEITSRAGDHMGIQPDRLIIQGDKVVDPESGASVMIRDLGPKFQVMERYTPPQSVQMHEPGVKSKFGTPEFQSMPIHMCYAYNTQAAIVEVDEATGAVKVLTVVSANDVGKALNPDAIIGQIQGGVMMGVGFALSERFLVKDGVNTTDTLAKVRLPSAAMTPEIIPVIVEVPHPFGPEGAKGFAEAPSLATAPAILNAIYNATGVRIHDLPADEERVKAALEQHRKQ